MINPNEQTYIPHQATAESIAAADEGVEAYVRSLFPDVNTETIESFRLYTVAKLLDGIHYGLELSDATPMEAFEAYRIGRNEGYAEGYDDGINGG